MNSRTEDVTLSALGGEYMETATVLEWLVTEGDKVKSGQPILIVETAKASVEVEAPADGYVVNCRVQPGDEVEVGAVLAQITSSPDHRPSEISPRDEPQESGEEKQARGAAKAFRLSGRPKASPLARRMACEHGIDIGIVKPSSATGKISADDVERHIAAESGQADSSYRSAMASAAAGSLDIPQFNVAIDCDGEALMKRRTIAKSSGSPVTINDFLIERVARVLVRHPLLRAHWSNDRVIESEEINIAVAISTSHGLVPPVIPHANQLSAEEISATMSTLQKLAEERRLAIEHLQGASFTVSNLGAYGVNDFTAIVSKRQSAILAISTFQPAPALVDDKLVWRTSGRLRLTADHRVLDGVEAARFLMDLKKDVEEFLGE